MTAFTRSRVALAAASFALVVRAGASAPRVPQTPANVPQAPPSGMIIGQIIDGNDTPVPEAIVQLTTPGLMQDPSSPRGRVMADAEGRFFFSQLPAGEYFLYATKEGYLGGGYGQRRPYGQTQNIVIAADERRAGVVLTIWRYGVIAGSVVDEAGEPVVGIGVRALERRFTGGRVVFGDYISPGASAITDDRGQFRIADLRPATYVVGVPVTQTTLPVVTLDAAVQDVEIRNDLFYGGVMEAAPLGTRGILQFGDFALLTLARVVVPPPPASNGRRQNYRSTYFPDSATVSAATPIVIGAGDERSDLTITLRPVPAVRISGRLTTPNGDAVPPIMLRLLGDAMNGVADGLYSGSGAMIAMFTTANARSTVDGRFTFLDVPPGEYVLSQANRFLIREVQAGREPYWVSQSITVGTNDIDDLTVALSPALRVEGRRVFNGSSSIPPIIADGAMTFETPFGGPGRFVATAVRGKQAFSTVAPGGRVIVRPTEFGGWFVQSITLDGRDVTDRAFDLQSDATTFVITYTDKPSKVGGVVKDVRGPVDAAAVIAFPVDPARWTGYGTGSRLLRRATTTRGAYTFDHLPPGEYYVIAIDEAQSDDWQDPKRLEVFARQATRLSVAAFTPATLDLAIRDVR